MADDTEGGESESEPGESQASSGSTRTSSRASVPQGAKTIVGLMGVTVAFAVIGEEIKSPGGPGLPTGAPKILVGGVVGTSVLVLISHAGDAGRQFALGLALVSMVTATLVYGGPVWAAANKSFGSKPTGSSGATAPTTPGTNTATSVATVATNLGG